MKFKKTLTVLSLAILSSVQIFAIPTEGVPEQEVTPYALICCEKMSIYERYTRSTYENYTYTWVDKGVNKTCYESSEYRVYAKICQNCGANHGSTLPRFYVTNHSTNTCPRS